MSDAARRFFSGDTEKQAVLEAAGHFGLPPAELAYRPVDKKHGFLRRPKVVIEVDPASPRRPAGAPVPAPAAVPAPDRASRPAAPNRDQPVDPRPQRSSPVAAPPAFAADAGSVVAEPAPEPARGVDGALLAARAVAALAGLRLDAAARVAIGAEGEEVQVDLQGADRPALIARQGEILRACEYLVRRMVRDLPSGGVSLDSGGFREEREETLRRRAAAAAEEVRRSGEAVLLEPLPAAERRIVHVAIQDELAVASESEGEGDLKRVRIVPAPPSPGSPPAEG